MNRRLVPLIVGVVAILAACGLAFWATFAWWSVIIGALLLGFGWVSIKTALFADDREIDELTGRRPMSDRTADRLRERL